jgi:hypothetical protein
MVGLIGGSGVAQNSIMHRHRESCRTATTASINRIRAEKKKKKKKKKRKNQAASAARGLSVSGFTGKRIAVRISSAPQRRQA